MKNKKILLVIIVFLVIVLVAFAGVYAYITLDVFRSPKQLFAKYAGNQYDQIKNLNVGALKTVNENFKTKPTQTEYETKIDIDDENVIQLKGTLKLDPINYIGELNLKINQNDNELANNSLYIDQEKIAVKIPELNEKYFSAELNTAFDELKKKSNIELSENITELSVDKIKEYKTEFVNLYNKYLEKTKLKLTDDKFSADKNVEVDVNGVKLTANRYILTMSKKDVSSLLTELLSELVEEPILAELLTEEQLTEFKKSVTDMKEEMAKLAEENNNTLKVCIYENSGNTVKVEILVDDEIAAEFMLVKTSETESNIIVNTIVKKSSDGTVGSNQSILYTINVENENTTTVTCTSSVAYDKEDIKSLKEYYEEEGYYYYTEESIDEMYKDTKSTQKTTTTLNGDTATSKVSIEAPEESGPNISKLQINYKFGDQVKFEKLTDTIRLEEYKDNQEKRNELIAECMQNLQNHPNSLAAMFLYSSFSKLTTNKSETASNESSEVDYYKKALEEDIEETLNACLDSYKRDLQEDENTNIGDYLTITKMSEMAVSSTLSDLEFIDSSTIKCSYFDNTYYVNISIDGNSLSVKDVTAHTEEEYETR